MKRYLGVQFWISVYCLYFIELKANRLYRKRELLAPPPSYPATQSVQSAVDSAVPKFD